MRIIKIAALLALLSSCNSVDNSEKFKLQKSLINEVMQMTFLCSQTFEYNLQFNPSKNDSIIEYHYSNGIYADSLIITTNDIGKLEALYNFSNYGIVYKKYQLKYLNEQIVEINEFSNPSSNVVYFDSLTNNDRTYLISYNDRGLISKITNSKNELIESCKYVHDQGLVSEIIFKTNRKGEEAEYLNSFAKNDSELDFSVIRKNISGEPYGTDKYSFHLNGKVKLAWMDEFDSYGNWIFHTSNKDSIRTELNNIVDKNNNWTTRTYKGDTWLRKRL